jgi:hypothetical protein
MTIGEFSRRSQLSPKALRLYERLGLLRPVAVDQRNGYRRYHESQLYTARLIFHGMVTADSDGPVEVCVPVRHPRPEPAGTAAGKGGAVTPPAIRCTHDAPLPPRAELAHA